MVDPSGENRFNEARNGDHLMVPFQCELCHFRNIFGRDPSEHNPKDQEVFSFIRRANLDCFWSREPATVKANLRNLCRMLKTEDRFGFDSVSPPMGPFPLEDSIGMKGALAILDRSLDPGSYATHVQWETFRKSMSALTNVTQAGVAGLADSVGAYQRNKIWITSSVTHKFWFNRFMEGVHKRVGEIKRQDETVTIDVLKAIQLKLELEWHQTKDQNVENKRKIAELGVWFIVGFCCGLRGEEIMLIELAGTRNSFSHFNGSKPYFKVMLSGRTKGNQLTGAKVTFPCVERTNGNDLNPGIWMQRLVAIRDAEPDDSGRLFFRRLVPGKVSEWECDFYSLLEAIQETTNSIERSINVREAYGILRSIRRGATVHARNMGVSKEVIEAVHRWQREALGTGYGIRLDLIDVYTSLDALSPTLLKYSQSF